MFWNNVRVRNGFKRISSSITIFALALSSVSPTFIYGVEFDEEIFDSKTWNLLENAKKLMKPIKNLNENSSIEEIAKAAGSFKKKLDGIYNTGISIDEAFDMVIQELAEKGVYIKKKELKPFIKLVKKYSKKGKNDQQNQITMNTKSLIGCVTVFCGCLICILPFPGARLFGAGVIVEGVKDVIVGYAEESDKKRKFFRFEETAYTV